MPEPSHKRGAIVSLINERIGSVGGIQRFDSRVLQDLSVIAAEQRCAFQVIAMNGAAADAQLPRDTEFFDASGGRLRLLWLLLCAHVRGIDQLFVGHIRLVKLIWPLRLIFRRTRYVLFAHGIEVWDAGHTRLHRAVTRSLLNALIDDVVAVSQFTADRMIKAFSLCGPRIHILPNALSVTEQMLSEPCASSAGISDGPVILTVARMDKHDMQKGIPVALHAISHLRTTFPTIRYRIVGDGELRAKHEALASALDIEANVEFVGRLPEPELGNIYRTSDVFLLPSAKEGFGIVFLEAWRYGLPIVCGNVDASAEVVDHGVNGLAVSPENPIEIAAALDRILKTPSMRQSFIEKGRTKLLKHYSGRQFTETLRAIVRSVDGSKTVVARERAGASDSC